MKTDDKGYEDGSHCTLINSSNSRKDNIMPSLKANLGNKFDKTRIIKIYNSDDYMTFIH